MSLTITLYAGCKLTSKYNQVFKDRNTMATYLGTVPHLDVYTGDDIYFTNSGTISIDNVGSGDIYGLYANSYANNAVTYGQTSTATGTIDINNIGDGNVYGIYTNYSAQNAAAYSPNSKAVGIIDITNIGNGNAYGLYSTDSFAFNTYVDQGEATGIINIKNTGLGNAYGIRGRYSYNTTDINETSIIEIINASNSLAVGLYGLEAAYNEGTITIHNLANGTAVGVLTDANGYIYNFGTITIDRETYTDTDGTVYSADTAKGGLAIGIYGAQNSEIINQNTGKIIINDAQNAYGIYAETGSTVTNLGQIIIDGNASHENAIKLNRGTLFQDGKLIIGANHQSCSEGYILQNGLCYKKLICGAGYQVENECICNDNAIKQSGICYNIKDCGQGSQLGNNCVCSSGYVWQDGICYEEKSCG